MVQSAARWTIDRPNVFARTHDMVLGAEPMPTSITPFNRSITLLSQIHGLISIGQGSSDQAGQIREELDLLAATMTDEQNEQLRQISEELSK